MYVVIFDLQLPQWGKCDAQYAPPLTLADALASTVLQPADRTLADTCAA